MLTQEHYSKNRKRFQPPPPEPKSPRGWKILLFFSAIVGILFFYKGVDFIEQDEDGNIQISKERQEKMERELEEYENAEQYVIKASYNGYYPCFNCGGRKELYLYRGEVWRYGVTKRGQSGRYPQGMPFDGLIYEVQFIGSIYECLVLEKKKIYG
ncbi:MAG: hypothetical protein AAGG68_22620 [Bacteroidota bacterium]